MNDFHVWDHTQNRFVSWSVSGVLDETVGRAVREVAAHYGLDSRRTEQIVMHVTNSMHTGVDTAISFYDRKRQIKTWSVAADFLIKEISDSLSEALDPHQEHFEKSVNHAKNPGQEHPDNKWSSAIAFASSEAIALAKALFMPRTPKRPGY